MVVLNLNQKDMATVVDALDCYCDSFAHMRDNAGNDEDREEMAKMTEYSSELRQKARAMDLQELVERCMSYFWDMVEDNDCVPDEFEDLAEDMGLSSDEVIELFRKAGFE
jgi:hypothetical protein